MTRGLFIGRFQPPHIGHRKVIETILEVMDEVVIVVAAAQISHTMKNPLTAGERVELMDVMLRASNISRNRYQIIPVPDIQDNKLWPLHVLRYIPKVDIFYSNNPFTNLLFSELKFKIASPGLIDRDHLEGTFIRQQIRNNKLSSKILTKEVITLLRKWKIPYRLSQIGDTDAPARPGSELNASQ